MKTTMMRIWLAGLAVALSACGSGGGNAGEAPFGNGGGGAAAVADVVVELSKAAVTNGGSDAVVVKATALDASRNTLTGVPIVVAADSDAIVAGGSGTTGDAGNIEATLTIGANRSNRVINVSVTSGSIVRTALVQVVGARLTGTAIPAIVPPGGSGKVQFRLLDQVGNAMANQAVTVTAAGLTPASGSGSTDANGDFEFPFTAPTTSGAYTITATAGGATTTPAPTVQVQSAGTVGPISGVVTAASVSANPSVVGVNAVGSTTNRTEIRALFLGANNQPIRNARVWFDLDGDANTIGGTFTAGVNQLLYSDVNGVVTTAYVPGSRSSPTNGVTIRACYSSVDVAPTPANCTTAARTTLTVTAEPLGVSIGTNEFVEVDTLNYHKRFVVSVVDSAGVAMPDVNVSTSLDLPVYRKGFWSPSATSWIKTTLALCLNEDINRNGVLESGEDINNSARLEPGKSDVRIQLLHPRTRADGTVEVLVSYAKSFGSWVDATITVAASGVSGSEGRAQYRLEPVPVLADALTDVTKAPAFVQSPYGATGDCTTPP